MEKIGCTRCQTRLRYPLNICNNGHMLCKQCNAHLLIRQGDIYTPDCTARVKEATYINQFIRGDIKDECQYGCGAKGTPLDLGKHEQECSYTGDLVQCLFKDCKWQGFPKPLINHFIEKHCQVPPIIISSRKKREFRMHPTKSPQLVLQYHENSAANFIYWVILRKIKTKSYLVVINAGKFGNIDKQHQLRKYTINLIKDESIKTDTIISMSSIAENKVDPRNQVQFDAFLKRPALKLLLPNQVDYNITIPIPDLAYEVETKCQVCDKLSRNMTKRCEKADVLHLLCNDCAKKHKYCPCCKPVIDAQLPCRYVANGCMMRGTSKMMDVHQYECVHQETKCVLCTWSGEKKGLPRHCTMHGAFYLGSLYVLEKLDKTYPATYLFESQYFIMVVLLKIELRFMVLHITNEKTSKYYAQVRFQNRDTKSYIDYKFHCQALEAKDYKKDFLETSKNYHMFPEHVVAQLKTSKDKLFCSLHLMQISS